MTETSPAMAVSAHLFAEDAIWHYSNPNLPGLQGDHVGPAAIGAFFAATLNAISRSKCNGTVLGG